MSELNTVVDDSIGATEAQTDDQDVISTETDNNEGVEGGQAETNEADESGLEEVAYEIGEIQATEAQIKSWREAYETKQSKDKDYTQKTQTLAEERKAAEALRDQLEQEREFYESLQSELDEIALGDLKGVDLAELIETDPAQYERTKQRIEQKKQWKQSYQQKLQAKQNELTAQAQQALFKDLDWVGNEAKYKADTDAITNYVKDRRMEKSFSKVADPQIMKALLDAAKYHQLMAKKPAVTKQIKKAPTIAKPNQASKPAPKSLAERMFPNMK